MPESKITATERLRGEGRWEQASSFREEIRSKLRAEGLMRREAAEQAWEAMLQAFPPQDDVEDQSNMDEAGHSLAAIPFRCHPDLDTDIRWAYERLDAPPERLDAPPGPGAVSLLKWARANRTSFYDRFVIKAMAKPAPQVVEQFDPESDVELAELLREFANKE